MSEQILICSGGWTPSPLHSLKPQHAAWWISSSMPKGQTNEITESCRTCVEAARTEEIPSIFIWEPQFYRRPGWLTAGAGWRMKGGREKGSGGPQGREAEREQKQDNKKGKEESEDRCLCASADRQNMKTEKDSVTTGRNPPPKKSSFFL